MRLFAVMLTVLMTAAQALAQENASQDVLAKDADVQKLGDPDVIVQDPADIVLTAADMNDIGSESDGVVIVKYIGATGVYDEADPDDPNAYPPGPVTTMRFDVLEVVKSDPRIPANGLLEVHDWGGGGEWSLSTHRVLKLSELSRRFKVGHTYFLFLQWIPGERRNGFALAGDAAGVFDVTGPKVNALIPTVTRPIAGRHAADMDKAEAIEALKLAAMAVRKRPQP